MQGNLSKQDSNSGIRMDNDGMHSDGNWTK